MFRPSDVAVSRDYGAPALVRAGQDVARSEKQSMQCYRTSMRNAGESAFGLQFTKRRSILEQHAVKDPAFVPASHAPLVTMGQDRGLFVGLLPMGRPLEYGPKGW